MRDGCRYGVLAPALLAAAALLTIESHAAPRRLDRSALRPSTAPPGFAMVQSLAAAPNLRSPLASSKGVPLGGARFLGMVSSETDIAVHAVVIERAGVAWNLVKRLALPLRRALGFLNGDTLGASLEGVEILLILGFLWP